MTTLSTVLKISLVVSVALAVVITLITDNGEYFRGMVFVACLTQWVSVIKSIDSDTEKAKQPPLNGG